MDMSHQGSGFGSNSRGRIILLGDGSEVLTSSDDTEMFDQSDEDKDLVSQVPKGDAPKSDAVPEKLDTPPKAEYKAVVGAQKPVVKKDDSKTD